MTSQASLPAAELWRPVGRLTLGPGIGLATAEGGMTRQRKRSGTFAHLTRGLVALAAGLTCLALLTPVANASPIGDADNAITAAWKEAGGDTSDLGAKQGDCYVAGRDLLRTSCTARCSSPRPAAPGR